MTHTQIIKSKTDNTRLDKYLVRELPGVTRSKIQNLIKSKFILLNGHRTKSSYLISKDDLIEILPFDKPETVLESQNIPLNILYEDENLIVINKQAGLVVHPGTGNKNGTMVNALLHHFSKLSYSASIRPGIVHRLDKWTSGVIVVAKSDFDHQAIAEQFKERSVKKIYKTIVWGKTEERGLVNEIIGRDPANRLSFKVKKSNGREAVTEYEMEKYLPPYSLLNIYPKSGRTHQIRVHLKFIGHPILADDLYGGGSKLIRGFHIKYTQKLKSVFRQINRTALHAYSIELNHPRTQKRMCWTAPLPADMKNIIQLLSDD